MCLLFSVERVAVLRAWAAPEHADEIAETMAMSVAMPRRTFARTLLPRVALTVQGLMPPTGHSPSGSECEFERQLQRSRAAFLKERVEAAEALVEHRGRLEKAWAQANERLRIRKVGVIQDVECIRAELEIHAVRQREASGEREINLR